MRKLISRDPRVLGGLPVFAGTRVPVRTVFECVEAGDDLDSFLADYPNVRREQVLAAIQDAEQRLLALSQDVTMRILLDNRGRRPAMP